LQQGLADSLLTLARRTVTDAINLTDAVTSPEGGCGSYGLTIFYMKLQTVTIANETRRMDGQL